MASDSCQAEVSGPGGGSLYHSVVRSTGVSTWMPSSAFGIEVDFHVSGRERKSASLFAVPGRWIGLSSVRPRASQVMASSAPR